MILIYSFIHTVNSSWVLCVQCAVFYGKQVRHGLCPQGGYHLAWETTWISSWFWSFLAALVRVLIKQKWAQKRIDPLVGKKKKKELRVSSLETCRMESHLLKDKVVMVFQVILSQQVVHACHMHHQSLWLGETTRLRCGKGAGPSSPNPHRVLCLPFVYRKALNKE